MGTVHIDVPGSWLKRGMRLFGGRKVVFCCFLLCTSGAGTSNQIDHWDQIKSSGQMALNTLEA